ncbi:lactonase family protein [Telluria mixta]|uniref:Lactonase family protein n=1 Tax=Telluria mixta TaxID=34071 RepID=A0ABT2C1C8_9BURK|nr:lactonase family protein [Telluria mixta]MCS0631131.1 lactonase family protein [Telluria mixta]WEM95669.1 lactonase family protein [Telluria mixta]
MTPNLRRRSFMRGAGALVACAAVPVRAHDVPAELVYVGTQGREVHALRFDPGSGALAAIGPAAQGARTTWAVAHPRLPILYGVDDDNARPGRVIAYAIDRATGALATMGEVAAGGNGTTFLALDAPARTLLAANFAGGSVSSIALDQAGRLGALVSTLAETGSGPHRRQASAHAHGAAVDPSGRFVLVPDLGADRVFVVAFDRATRVLAPHGAFAVPPGSGPRHLVFGADGRYAYLVNELTAQLMVLRWDPREGRLALVQALAMDDAAFTGQSSGAEVAVSPDGRFVYAANRGDNTLLVYRVDAATGMLAEIQRVPSGGQAPWSFTLHPSGRWLLVAHQKSGTVNVFGIDPASGLLADSGRSAAVRAAVSVTVVR